MEHRRASTARRTRDPDHFRRGIDAGYVNSVRLKHERVVAGPATKIEHAATRWKQVRRVTPHSFSLELAGLCSAPQVRVLCRDGVEAWRWERVHVSASGEVSARL